MLGAVIIVIGLYLVVWGKSKDHMISPLPIVERRIAAEPSPATIDLSKTSPIGFVAVDVSTKEIKTDSVQH